MCGATGRGGNLLDAFGGVFYTDFTPKATGMKSGWVLKKSYKPTHKEVITERYKVGTTVTGSEETKHAWGASVKAAYGGVTASANYDGYHHVSSVKVETSELEKTKSVTIEPGQATALWQWMLTLTMNGIAIDIPTDILWTTSSPSIKPKNPA